MEFTNQKFCQSCGMPLNESDDYGTEVDGSKSEHYCKYCYEKGTFTSEMTMEEMISFCASAMAEGNPGMSEDEAKEQMRQFFPILLRWKKD